jgi:palmitoyl-protein thioesterase
VCPSYDSPGLIDLANDIKDDIGPDTFVYMIRTNNDSNADQKETLFGNMDTMLARVAEQLKDLEELKDGFDAIGLSQGGVFLRAYVQKYGLEEGYPKVRNLITLGSPCVTFAQTMYCASA